LNRRRFLKYAGATGGVLLAGALGYQLYPFAAPAQTQISTTTQQQVTTQITSSTSTSTTELNVPYLVRDLDQQIQPYFNDLASFANGTIANSEMKADTPTYQNLLRNAETLRQALSDYQPQNTESEGQRHRLDEMTLGTLSLYSWFSRMLEDDIGIIPPISDNLSAMRGCGKVILNRLEYDLHPENSGDDRAVANIGKTFTDVKNEADIAPLMRNKFKAIYDALNPDARASLKKMIESYSPNADAIGDYRKVTEEDLGILCLNDLMGRHEFTVGDEYRTAAVTAVENGTSKGSSLGKIANRSSTLMTMMEMASAEGWKDSITSAYSELPANHRELTNYNLALTIMNTPTFINLRNDSIKTGHVDPTLSWILKRMLTAVYSLADRDSYFINAYNTQTTDWGDNTGIEQDGRYFWTDFWESYGKAIGTPPSLTDIADRGFGYGGYRQYHYWIVTKNLLDWMNTIPVFVYRPGRGVVVGNT
jgi:hypothetical protein